MPKMKTNPGAKKRFTLTGSGKIKRKHTRKRKEMINSIVKNWISYANKANVRQDLMQIIQDNLHTL